MLIINNNRLAQFNIINLNQIDMGLSIDQSRVKDILIDYASRGGTITYQNLSNLADLGLDMSNEYHRSQIGELLCDISTFEFNEKRPLPSAIVLTTRGYAGDGFFKLCEELGDGSWEKLKNNKKFIKKKKEECFEHYSKLKSSK